MEDTENRELRLSKTYGVSVEQMWQAWVLPEHLANWWGPDGFTNTIHQMDFREGGEWKLTMHGPDGTNYPNRSIFREIVPFKKIAFEHFNPHFFTTVRFESHGTETMVDWAMLFDNPEIFDIVIKTHKADEGLKQNLEKLEKYLQVAAINPL